MIPSKNISLKAFNTFGIDVKAALFIEIDSLLGFRECLDNPLLKALPWLVMGGGSNVLLTRDFEGLVLKNNIKGIEKVSENAEHVYVKAGAGEIWHQFVQYCISNNYGGAENLSLIPGSVGAGPMQNIGAYGAELKDIFFELEALHLATNEVHIFTKEACKFGYRNSVFKNHLKQQYIILSVTFELSKKPVFNIHYGAIETELQAMGVQELSLKAVSDAVCKIRRSKLPDPAVIGNAGSFFKNPEVSIHLFTQLKEKYPDLVGYPTGPETTKIAAGWMIEKCGWKGRQIDNYGVHKNQALVLVNYGGADGEKIYKLSKQIQAEVKDVFGVGLEIEVNIV
jgi:UDP-N-acetylmuramate dehydrogenase